MAASAKKRNTTEKTKSLTDFLAKDGGTGGGSTSVPKPVSGAHETATWKMFQPLGTMMIMLCTEHLQ